MHGAQAAAGRRQLRRLPRAGPQAGRATTRSRWSTRSTRTGSRGRRRPRSRSCDVARRRPGRPLPAGRQRRQHHRLLEGLHASTPPTDRARTPRMCGFQAAGAAPIVTGAAGAASRRRSPPRSGSATRRPGPGAWPPATSPAGGSTPSPTGQILAAYRLLARSEGVFVEPASARQRRRAAAGRRRRRLEPGQRVVCTVTGNGLKDPEWAISGAPAPVTIPVDAAAAAASLGLA